MPRRVERPAVVGPGNAGAIWVSISNAKIPECRWVTRDRERLALLAWRVFTHTYALKCIHTHTLSHTHTHIKTTHSQIDTHTHTVKVLG